MPATSLASSVIRNNKVAIGRIVTRREKPMIKRIIAMSLIIAFASCGPSKADSPEDAVKAYWENVINGDYDKAWEALSDSTRNRLTKQEFLNQQARVAQNNLSITEGFAIDKTVINGNRATVHYRLRTSTPFGKRTTPTSTTVFKENGRWVFVVSDEFISQAKQTTMDDKDLIERITHGSVMTVARNWDADAENDGIEVFLDLKDEKGDTVPFEDIEMPVRIRVYTVKQGPDWKDVKDRLVYEATGSTNSWKDGNPFFGEGIKVPYDKIELGKYDKDHGVIYAAATLPNGRVIEAKEDFVRLTPD